MGTQLRCSTKLLFVVAMALGLGLAWPASRAGAVPLIDGYGGAAGYGTDFLPPNDDGSSSAIDLTGSFPGGLLFFGGPYTTMYVNTNGNITFNGPLPTYTPNPFPVASQPMIAPYWGDVDIRGSGFPARNGVWWVLLPGRIVITWNHVGYYSIHDDKEMDFQMILTNSIDCGEGDFDVEFRYNVCGWTTGDASGGSGGFGGTPAQAGFDAGNLMDFVELPGSRTMSILDLCTTSNVGEPGIWRFSVRNGTVSCPGTGEPCDTGELGVCAAGLTQCIAGGVECLGVGTASAERCDGLDNDCNGATDEGMLCTEHEVCANGQCVPACFEGGCFAGDTCTAEGFCVETACIDVTCPPGERCVGGSCVAACTDVVCPHGRVCLAGRCVDVCDVVTCGDGSICVDGACVRRCPCSPCPEGSICAADGSCIPLGCDIVICDPGFYCEAGVCRDACDGAMCPRGEQCEVGECVPAPEPPDAGPPPPPPPPPPPSDAGLPPFPGVDMGATPTDAGGDARPTGRSRSASPGCGCETAGAPQLAGSGGHSASPWALLLALPLGAAIAQLRRRRRR